MFAPKPGPSFSHSPAHRASHDELVAPLIEVGRELGQVTSIGEVHTASRSYDIMGLILRDRTNPSPHHIFLAGGVHGEEPAGALAVARFCGLLARDYLRDFTFHIVPCVNPEGFDLGRRFGAGGRDLNRNFLPQSSEPECRAVMDWVSSLRPRSRDSYQLSLDLHEIDPNWGAEGFAAQDNPQNFYLYESCEERHRRIGKRVLEAGARFGAPCLWDTIYEDKNCGGVVSYPEANGNKVYAEPVTLDGWMAKEFTQQSFTFETPCGWPLEQRVNVHLAMLEEALKATRERLSR
jgi:hypothetical protein